MITLKHVADNVAPVLSVAAMMLYGSTALAQTATQTCRPAQVIPLTGTEPAAKIVIDAPLAEPLASRGVVVIPYCAENMRIAPVFGPGALGVSPRVGHIHVTVDEAPWHWADASGTPLILRGLPPGPHTVLIELVDANHQPVDKGTVTFDVPRQPRRACLRCGGVDPKCGSASQSPRRPQAREHQPNVNANASTPASRNSISKVRSTIGPGCLIS